MLRFPVLLALLFALSGAQALAQPSQSKLVRLADEAESGAEPARAAELYRQAVEADPSSRLARRAHTRLRFLEDRSEGDFAPLARLQQVRSHQDGLTREELSAFGAEVDAFPEGRVRREARGLVADLWLRHLDDPLRAREAIEAWLNEPGLEDTDRHRAESALAIARSRLGDVSGAIASLESGGFRPELLYLRALRVEQVGRPLSWAVLAAFVALALAMGGWRGARPSVLRRIVSPGRIAMALLVLVPPTWAAARFDYTLWPQAPQLAAGLALLLALSSVFGEGLRVSHAPLARRRIVAALAALSCIAWAFLVAARGEFIESMFIWYGV